MGWKQHPMNPLPPSRVIRSKQQARHYYDRLSPFYDLFSGGAESRLRDDAIRRLAIRPGEKVLEIGAGTGSGLLRIAEAAGPAGAAVGMDLAEGMLAAARNKLRGAGLAGRTALVSADGARLPFRGEAFHAVFLGFTLELFDTPEIPVVLAECRRILKPDGRLGVAGMALVPNPNAMTRLYEAMHAAFPVWVDCRPIHSRRAVEAAGFTVTDTSRGSMFSLPVDIIISRKQI